MITKTAPRSKNPVSPPTLMAAPVPKQHVAHTSKRHTTQILTNKQPRPGQHSQLWLMRKAERSVMTVAKVPESSKRGRQAHAALKRSEMQTYASGKPGRGTGDLRTNPSCTVVSVWQCLSSSRQRNCQGNRNQSPGSWGCMLNCSMRMIKRAPRADHDKPCSTGRG